MILDEFYAFQYLLIGIGILTGAVIGSMFWRLWK